MQDKAVPNLIITGAAGFIGSSLVDTLCSQYPAQKLILVDNFNDYYSPQWKREFLKKALQENKDRIVLLEQDISRRPEELCEVFKKALAKLNESDFSDWTMVHLAAKAGVRPSVAVPYSYAQTNTLGTLSILETCRTLGIEKLINASSSSVYGRHSSVPFSEDKLVSIPQSPYAASKLAAEIFCQNYSELHSLKCISLRFFTVYGPRQRPDLAIHKFTRKILASQPIDIYGDGSTARDYTYIDEIVSGVINAIVLIQTRHEEKGFHEVINLGSSRPITLADLVKTLEEVIGLKAKLDYKPLPDEDVIVTFANVDKARRLLDYSPSLPFNEGIKRFYEWYKEWQNQN